MDLFAIHVELSESWEVLVPVEEGFEEITSKTTSTAAKSSAKVASGGFSKPRTEKEIMRLHP